MNKRKFENVLIALYVERKPWLHYMYDGAGYRMRCRMQLHFDLQNPRTLPAAFYSERYAKNMLLVIQRSKPKHIIDYKTMVGHITTIMKRKRWKRVTPHHGYLYWRRMK